MLSCTITEDALKLHPEKRPCEPMSCFRLTAGCGICSIWEDGYITCQLVSSMETRSWKGLHMHILLASKSKSKGLPQQAEVTQGVPVRLRPRIFLTFRHYKGGRSSAKSTGRLYPRRNPWYSLSAAVSTSGHMVLLVEPRKKIPSDTTENRSRNSPTSSAVP